MAECARRNSPTLQADLHRVASTRGDTLEARSLLPQNPTVAVSVGSRSNPAGDRAVNVYGTLTQSIELGGQRRRRIKAVDARREVYEHDAALTERQIVAEALLAYYDVLAAREAEALVARAAATATDLQALAKQRATEGLGTALDHQRTVALRMERAQELALAAGQRATAEARLADLVGLDPTASVEATGALTPLPLPAEALPSVADDAVTQRPEVERARAVRLAQSRQIDLLKRERIPDPSLSFFVQRDGFDERVLGGGLSIAIPLPAPLGRTNKGEIEAARARVREADARITAEQRSARRQVTVAYHDYRAQQQAVEVFGEQSVTDIARALDDVNTELAAGRLPVRDALLAQQELLDALRSELHARHALCRASVMLALAAGLPLDGGQR